MQALSKKAKKAKDNRIDVMLHGFSMQLLFDVGVGLLFFSTLFELLSQNEHFYLLNDLFDNKAGLYSLDTCAIFAFMKML